MALTKEVINDKIEIIAIGDYKTIQCREATIIKEDGVELSRAFTRHCLLPTSCRNNGDGTFTHTDTDISGESAEVQAMCSAVWTDAIVAAWKAHIEQHTILNTSQI